MIRDIKYQAYDTHEEVISRVDYLDFAHGIVGLFNENKRDYEQPLHRVKLMQYTGLQDKNGVEIFEGYIVKNDKGEIGYIVHLVQEVGYVVVLENRDYRLGHRNTGEGYIYADKHEVIGNIYENKGFLE